MRNILIVAGGAVAVAAIAAGVYFGTRPSAPGAGADGRGARPPDKATLLNVQPTDHVLGDPKAPITLIEYASLTCPHCAHFNVAVLPEMKKKWIDTGKVKLIYRDFPLDQTAAKAAQLAECAGKDKYFGVIDMIFRTQPNWATASDPIAELAKSLRIAGMGETEVKACLANDAVRQRRGRRLSRRRDAGRQFDSDAVHQRPSVQGRALRRGARRGLLEAR